MHIIGDTPTIVPCLVRKEFVTNFTETGFLKAHIFGIRCQEAMSLQFQIRFEEDGYGGSMFCLPIQALCWKECDQPHPELVQPWDTFSSRFSAHSFAVLKNTRAWLLNVRGVHVYFPDGKGAPLERIESRYLWTIDFEGSPLADCFEQHKQLHVLQVSGGWFAAVPNNRVLMEDTAFCKTTESLPKFHSLAAEFCSEVTFHLPKHVVNPPAYAVPFQDEYPDQQNTVFP